MEDTVIDMKPEMLQEDKVTASDVANKTVFGLCWVGKKTTQLPQITANVGKVIGKCFAKNWNEVE